MPNEKANNPNLADISNDTKDVAKTMDEEKFVATFVPENDDRPRSSDKVASKSINFFFLYII